MPQEQIVNEKAVTFTPGPWRVEPTDRHEVLTADTRFRVLLTTVAAGAVREEWAANARLIAAAPELFDACLSALEYDAAIRQCANDPQKMATFCTAQGDDLDVLYARWITSARIAIAKVKGSAR